MKPCIGGAHTLQPQAAHGEPLGDWETGRLGDWASDALISLRQSGGWLSLSSLFTDSHEDHACSHVQAPHRPGDPAVHLGTPSLTVEQGYQADPPWPGGTRSQDKALTP